MTGEARQESLRAKHAPELAGDRDGLMLAQPDSEGLQHHDPGSDAPILDKEGHITPDTSPNYLAAGGRRHNRFGWLTIAAILIALAIGLGVGVGVGYAAHSSHGSDAARSKNAATVTVTASPPTTTIFGVTSGTTGISNLVCGNNNSYTSPSYSSNQPNTFTEVCNTDYGAGSQTLSNGTTVYVDNLKWNITYSFQHCMDNCVSYNAQMGAVICQAVVYTANLSFAVPRYNGNCWLKSSRGRGGIVEGPGYSTYAAAYLDL